MQFEMYPMPMPEMYDNPGEPPGEVGLNADALAPASADCQVEFVEEIPTGHDTPLALEVTSILVEPPAGAGDDRATLPALAPLAFGAPIARAPIAELTHAEPYADAAEHVTELLDLAWARGVLAIAEALHSGRISGGASDAIDPVAAHAVLALAGPGSTDAADRLARSRARVSAQADAIAAREIASLAIGVSVPLVELARELGLSALATELLVAALAPRARREIGRLYRTLAGEPGRPTCDDGLLVTLLAGDDARLRDLLYGELADDAALSRHGLVVRDPRGGLDVDDALVARLRGQPAPRSAATTLRAADRSLDELDADRATLRALALELAAPRSPDDPVRVVIRGRRGSGRHAAIAALASRVDRRIACIDAGQLPHGPARAEALRRELSRAAIARAIPVISGVEARDGADSAVALQIAQVLRAHPGPLVVRTSEHARIPVPPGALDVTLPPLSDADRRRAFAAALERHAIPADPELLAARYRIGPGEIARVAAEARRRIERGDDDPAAVADTVARQQIASRLAGAATRVIRLATWDQILLHDELLDGLDELIGRARHGRTVFEDWGYDRRSDAGRGLTAVFHGPSGTGKAMAAGVVARELGFELYRVDLARLLSRPAGEAEHILDELFAAAEDGRFMLLFRGLDALETRRPRALDDADPGQVAEYLAQRLDAFDGIAIVATRHGGPLDPALDRLPVMRLRFPVPDEALRTQLWAAHLPPQTPTAGRLDLAALARRFALSGGDIRDCALRAAFLAAQDGSGLTQVHLERAVLLEIRDRRKRPRSGPLD
jgi:SpoVK/Ycf46/Vps4 family AAA+-type ATPase